MLSVNTAFIYLNINFNSLFDSIICNDSSHSYINTHFAIVTLQTSLKETQMSLETLNAPVNVVFKTPHEVLFHWEVIRCGARLPVLHECEWRVQTQHVWMELSLSLLSRLPKWWVTFVRLKIYFNHKEILTRPAIFAFIRWSRGIPWEWHNWTLPLATALSYYTNVKPEEKTHQNKSTNFLLYCI